MRTTNRRNGGLFTTFAFALALGVYSSGLTALAGQPPENAPPQQSAVAAPVTVELPQETTTGPAYSIFEIFSQPYACVDCQAAPACCDPVSRVPNFLGDFVARSGGALVNQPSIISGGSNGTASTTTILAFTGRGSDVAGGLGSNTFYAPLVFKGPGGPYLITTNVTGTGVPPFPISSILNENAQLTAKVDANFPGATFVSGTGLLQPPFTLMFDYLQTKAGQTPTPPQIVPGLVAAVNLANPSGGGLVGRNNYFDNGSPLPNDRVFFDYNHVGAFNNGLGTQFDINRYVFGVEKTFLNGFGSVEVRVPFAGTANSDQTGGQGLALDNAEFGNVGLLLKGTLFRNANWIVSAGMGVSMPTADDSRILVGGQSVIEIRNDAWLLQPILGAAWAPNDRFYAQAGLQFDFDANGNPVYVRQPGGDLTNRGILTDQTYLYASGAVGYWLYKADSEFLSGVSLQGELHYNRTLGNQDFVQTGSVLVTDLNGNIDVLNATAGVNVVLRDQATLSLGVSFPLAGERLYDWDLMARLNFRFGPVSR